MTQADLRSQDPGTMLRAALFHPTSKRNPHPLLHAVRESSPVLRTGDGITFVLDYRSIDQLSGAETSRRPQLRATADPQLEGSSLRTWELSVMPFVDPPDHTRLRSLVASALTTRDMKQMRPVVRQLCRERIGQLRMEATTSIDLSQDFAHWVPFAVAMVLVGVPRSDWPTFRRWTSQRADALQRVHGVRDIDTVDSALEESHGYLSDLVRQRRDAPQDDLLTRLSETSVRGARLSDYEVVAAVNQLVSAGFETVAFLISNMMWSLSQHQDQLAAALAGEVAPADVVQETLRWEGGLILGPAVFAESTIHLHGGVLSRGERVCPVLAAGNRDPSVFARPDAFRPSRQGTEPLTFGGGQHRCLGAPLARIEAEEALGAVLDEFSMLELVEPAKWSYDLGHRGVTRLDVASID